MTKANHAPDLAKPLSSSVPGGADRGLFRLVLAVIPMVLSLAACSTGSERMDDFR